LLRHESETALVTALGKVDLHLAIAKKAPTVLATGQKFFFHATLSPTVDNERYETRILAVKRLRD